MAIISRQTSKRVQLDKANAVMLSIVIGASVLSASALVVSKSFYSQASYLNRVATEKEKALKQLKKNESAVSTLVASYKTFTEKNPNLIGGSRTGNGERDGDNARLILDALPSKYDFPAMATSIEKLLTGYSISSITGSDDTISQSQADNAQLVEMPFKMEVDTDYQQMQKLLNTFEKSIRPFQLESVTFTGTNNKLKGVISAKTFYQPEKNLKIVYKVIK